MRIIAIFLGLAIGLGIDYWLIIPSTTSVSAAHPVARSYLDAFVNFWTYFTHLTNLGLVLVYAAELTGTPLLAWFRAPRTRALMAGYITLVMVFYHFMLAPYYTFEGGLLVATILLHYVAPLYYLGWWTAFARHGALRFGDIPAMLIPGLIYVAWGLVRGAFVHEYPYDILDVEKHGYAGVAIGVGIIIAAVALFCALMVVIDKRLGRRSSPA
jgi:hypothetical protein